MKRRKVLEVRGEGGSIVFEELVLESKTYYTKKVSENHFAKNEEHNESVSPLYSSFSEAMSHSQIDIFILEPNYIDPEIWNDLSEIYMNYCDGKAPKDYNNEGWNKALGINDPSHVIDELVSLGLSNEQAILFCDILCQIKLNGDTEKEIDELLDDPFAFEGGGPGVRETILLLAKEIQGETWKIK